MSEPHRPFNGDPGVLHGKAIRTPLPDEEAERTFHENMMTVADARERKAELLADPDVPVLDAYEAEFDRAAENFRRRLRSVAGDDYEEVVAAYHRGARNDRVGRIASYCLEGLWRIQQCHTVTEALFFPIVLRYPDCYTVNVRFAGGHATTESVLYESPESLSESMADEHVETYYAESNYSQRRAAEYLRETAEIIREQFPDPDETSFEERKYGGVVSAAGRRGTTFSEMLEPVVPDPDRFSDPVDRPVLVDEGPEARRTERELLPDGDVVL